MTAGRKRLLNDPRRATCDKFAFAGTSVRDVVYMLLIQRDYRRSNRSSHKHHHYPSHCDEHIDCSPHIGRRHSTLHLLRPAVGFGSVFDLEVLGYFRYSDGGVSGYVDRVMLLVRRFVRMIRVRRGSSDAGQEVSGTSGQAEVV